MLVTDNGQHPVTNILYLLKLASGIIIQKSTTSQCHQHDCSPRQALRVPVVLVT